MDSAHPCTSTVRLGNRLRLSNPQVFPSLPPLMTDLLSTIPSFPTKSYAHLIPSLEQHLITTTDLLTLDAIDIAKRSRLPVLDVRRLANHITAVLHTQLGLRVNNEQNFEIPGSLGDKDGSNLRNTGNTLVKEWRTISTLDPDLDIALGGGIPPGYITEIAGERHVDSMYTFVQFPS